MSDIVICRGANGELVNTLKESIFALAAAANDVAINDAVLDSADQLFAAFGGKDGTNAISRNVLFFSSHNQRL